MAESSFPVASEFGLVWLVRKGVRSLGNHYVHDWDRRLGCATSATLREEAGRQVMVLKKNQSATDIVLREWAENNPDGNSEKLDDYFKRKVAKEVLELRAAKATLEFELTEARSALAASGHTGAEWRTCERCSVLRSRFIEHIQRAAEEACKGTSFEVKEDSSVDAIAVFRSLRVRGDIALYRCELLERLVMRALCGCIQRDCATHGAWTTEDADTVQVLRKKEGSR